ncbi:MAG: ATP-binding protein [Pseudomonadota bacterium]
MHAANGHSTTGRTDDTAVRILIVDDDAADTEITGRFITGSRLNTEISTVSSGSDGLKALKNARYDAVVVDYHMADMTGEDFLERMQAPDVPPVASIVLTGAGDETIAAEVIKKGAHDYLTKNDLSAASIRRALLTAIDKVELLKDLERQRIELKRSNLELEQYAYVTSHDLQEPLRIIVSFLQLFEKRYADSVDDKGREYINYAVDGASRMQQMISSLLELSRIGRRGDEFVAQDLDGSLQEALANLKMTIDESGAVITHDPMPVISCIPPRMTQLFQNLIGNAIKYRGDDAPRVHVGVEPVPSTARERMAYATTIRNQTMWRFCIRDNGIGIDEQYAKRIFIVFQRLHARGEYPGTGIGLALCKKIVETHHGRIWMRSTPGRGSRFYFTLPSAQPNGHD